MTVPCRRGLRPYGSRLHREDADAQVVVLGLKNASGGLFVVKDPRRGEAARTTRTSVDTRCRKTGRGGGRCCRLRMLLL